MITTRAAEVPAAPCFSRTRPEEAFRHAIVVAQKRWAIDGRGGRNPYTWACRPDLYRAWQRGWDVGYYEMERLAVEKYAGAAL